MPDSIRFVGATDLPDCECGEESIGYLEYSDAAPPRPVCLDCYEACLTDLAELPVDTESFDSGPSETAHYL